MSEQRLTFNGPYEFKPQYIDSLPKKAWAAFIFTSASNGGNIARWFGHTDQLWYNVKMVSTYAPPGAAFYYALAVDEPSAFREICFKYHERPDQPLEPELRLQHPRRQLDSLRLDAACPFPGCSE